MIQTLNQLITELSAVSRKLSSGDIELYIDNTKKVQKVELGTGNNGNLYCNITTKKKPRGKRINRCQSWDAHWGCAISPMKRCAGCPNADWYREELKEEQL